MQQPQAPGGDPFSPLPRRTRFSAARRLLVGAAVALVAWKLLPAVPRKQELTIDLGERSETIRALSLTWVSVESGHEGGVRWRYPRGAPRRVTHSLSLLDGAYELRLAARRSHASDEAGGEETELRRRVTLEGRPTLVWAQSLTQ